MKQIVKKKVPALVLAVCLIISNATMTFAGSESIQPEPPSLTAIDQEISSTAGYLKSAVNVTTLNSASNFYNTSRLLTLLLRSGVDCSNLVDSYLAEITTNYVSNGDLTLEEPITAYAYLSIVLALSGRDATDFNGINLIKKYENAITNADQVTLNSISPYKLPHLYAAAYAYSKEFTDSSTCLSKLKTAILSYSDANGINFWGNSADNNGLGLAGLSILSNTDNAVKTLVNNAITFSQTLLKEDGTSAGDFKWTPSPNADSTATSLILYATYGKSELAAKSYAGLLTFKASDSTGTFKYSSADSVSNFGATIDAFYGLISYKAVLENQVSPFDVSDSFELAAEAAKNAAAISDTSAADDSNVDLAADIKAQSPATGDSSKPALFFFVTVIATCYIVSIGFPHISNNKKKKA